MRALAVFLLALACLAAAPAPALAEERDCSPSGYTYDAQRDASSNPVVATLVESAVWWLQSVGLRPCTWEEGLTVRMAPDLGMTPCPDDPGRLCTQGGGALQGDVWVLYRLVAEANSRRWSEVWVLCVTIWHELAHTAGLSHDEMPPYEDGKRGWLRVCERWADVFEDAARAERAAKRRAAKQRSAKRPRRASRRTE